jgi:hypothetical protein
MAGRYSCRCRLVLPASPAMETLLSKWPLDGRQVYLLLSSGAARVTCKWKYYLQNGRQMAGRYNCRCHLVLPASSVNGFIIKMAARWQAGIVASVVWCCLRHLQMDLLSKWPPDGRYIGIVATVACCCQRHLQMDLLSKWPPDGRQV